MKLSRYAAIACVFWVRSAMWTICVGSWIEAEGQAAAQDIRMAALDGLPSSTPFPSSSCFEHCSRSQRPRAAAERGLLLST